MRLEPSSPPGRSNRKARAFQREIVRLRDEGYTLDAIQAALADAGVQVSRSTVHREAARRRPGHSPSQASQSGSGPPLPGRATNIATDSRSGRDIAREFVEGRITNPLIRAKEQR